MYLPNKVLLQEVVNKLGAQLEAAPNASMEEQVGKVMKETNELWKTLSKKSKHTNSLKTSLERVMAQIFEEATTNDKSGADSLMEENIGRIKMENQDGDECNSEEFVGKIGAFDATEDVYAWTATYYLRFPITRSLRK